ncbi:MAG TPA: DUF4286 family protein [Puia sp.]|jgi:hypothetical protein|nr:DUF4286 family protein [Puia sp.]
MIVYNITFKIERNIAEEWLSWQTQEHIPEIMATNLFDDFKMYSLLEQDETEGVTFVIQYFTSSKKRYQKYISTFEAGLRKKAFSKWGSQSTGFCTIMEAVQ